MTLQLSLKTSSNFVSFWKIRCGVSSESISSNRLPALLMNYQSKKDGKYQDRYNQAPHLTQDTNGKVTTSRLDITNESQEVSPFPLGDHKASINRRARKHNKNKTEIT